MQEEEKNPFDDGTMYTYEELLNRINQKIWEEHPDLAGIDPGKISIKPPTIQQLPTKTAWDNFGEIVNNILKRDPEHFKKFISVELGTEVHSAGDNS